MLLKYTIALISEGVSVKLHFGRNEVCLFQCLVNLAVYMINLDMKLMTGVISL